MAVKDFFNGLLEGSYPDVPGRTLQATKARPGRSRRKESQSPRGLRVQRGRSPRKTEACRRPRRRFDFEDLPIPGPLSGPKSWKPGPHVNRGLHRTGRKPPLAVRRRVVLRTTVTGKSVATPFTYRNDVPDPPAMTEGFPGTARVVDLAHRLRPGPRKAREKTSRQG
jgi:hypothetical protein